MTRLPKKRGITQVEEDKSLILRQINYARLVLQALKLGDPPLQFLSSHTTLYRNPRD